MNSAILYSEVNIVCIAVLLILCIKVKDSMFIQEQRRLFLKVGISCIILFSFDCVWAFVNNNTLVVTKIANWIMNEGYYITGAVLGFFWFQYSETIQDSVLVRNKFYRKLSSVPLLILIVLSLISYKTGWLFYIDEGNIYHRGHLYVLQIITAYGYIAFTAIKAFFFSIQTEDYREKNEYKTLATFVIPSLIAGSIQVVFAQYPVLCIGNTFGILYVYLTLQEQLISMDALTKLNNRNQLFQYLSGKLNHIRDDKELYLLIMDIDYFKKVNDQYGHVEGDQALKHVANALMKTCNNRNCFISRYGGDEFVEIVELNYEESIDEICEHINQEIAMINVPYNLSVSIGYTKHTPEIKTQQQFIEKADQELYKIKKKR